MAFLERSLPTEVLLCNPLQTQSKKHCSTFSTLTMDKEGDDLGIWRKARRLTKVVASFKGNSLVLPKSLPSSPERTPSVSPRATDRCNEVTDPVRQVRFRFYELFSLLTIGSRFLQRDVYLLSISDLLILRILKEVDNDVQITCQWLASLLSWRKKLAITSIVRTDFSQDVLDRQILQFLHGKKRNMLVCDAVKLFQLSEEIGPLQTVRLIVYNFEKIWYGGATSNISLVVSFGYMDPQICSKIPNRHLLNEVVCGCGYFRYPSFCEKIVLVNWRSDKESDTVYNDFVSRDWPFEVKSRICFAKHHEVLKIVSSSDAGSSCITDDDLGLQSALLLLCSPDTALDVDRQSVQVDVHYRLQNGAPQSLPFAKIVEPLPANEDCGRKEFVSIDMKIRSENLEWASVPEDMKDPSRAVTIESLSASVNSQSDNVRTCANAHCTQGKPVPKPRLFGKGACKKTSTRESSDVHAVKAENNPKKQTSTSAPPAIKLEPGWPVGMPSKAAEEPFVSQKVENTATFEMTSLSFKSTATMPLDEALVFNDGDPVCAVYSSPCGTIFEDDTLRDTAAKSGTTGSPAVVVCATSATAEYPQSFATSTRNSGRDPPTHNDPITESEELVPDSNTFQSVTDDTCDGIISGGNDSCRDGTGTTVKGSDGSCFERNERDVPQDDIIKLNGCSPNVVVNYLKAAQTIHPWPTNIGDLLGAGDYLLPKRSRTISPKPRVASFNDPSSPCGRCAAQHKREAVSDTAVNHRKRIEELVDVPSYTLAGGSPSETPDCSQSCFAMCNCRSNVNSSELPTEKTGRLDSPPTSVETLEKTEVLDYYSHCKAAVVLDNGTENCDVSDQCCLGEINPCELSLGISEQMSKDKKDYPGDTKFYMDLQAGEKLHESHSTPRFPQQITEDVRKSPSEDTGKNIAKESSSPVFSLLFTPAEEKPSSAGSCGRSDEECVVWTRTNSQKERWRNMDEDVLFLHKDLTSPFQEQDLIKKSGKEDCPSYNEALCGNGAAPLSWHTTLGAVKQPHISVYGSGVLAHISGTDITAKWRSAKTVVENCITMMKRELYVQRKKCSNYHERLLDYLITRQLFFIVFASEVSRVISTRLQAAYTILTKYAGARSVLLVVSGFYLVMYYPKTGRGTPDNSISGATSAFTYSLWTPPQNVADWSSTSVSKSEDPLIVALTTVTEEVKDLLRPFEPPHSNALNPKVLYPRLSVKSEKVTAG